jgi:hypothetical protein
MVRRVRTISNEEGKKLARLCRHPSDAIELHRASRLPAEGSVVGIAVLLLPSSLVPAIADARSDGCVSTGFPRKPVQALPSISR